VKFPLSISFEKPRSNLVKVIPPMNLPLLAFASLVLSLLTLSSWLTPMVKLNLDLETPFLIVVVVVVVLTVVTLSSCENAFGAEAMASPLARIAEKIRCFIVV
jgi:hypothetical protein